METKELIEEIRIIRQRLLKEEMRYLSTGVRLLEGDDKKQLEFEQLYDYTRSYQCLIVLELKVKGSSQADFFSDEYQEIECEDQQTLLNIVESDTVDSRH